MVANISSSALLLGVKNVVGYDCGDDDNFRGSVMRTIYFGLIGILNIISILLLAAMYIRIFRAIQIWKHKQIGESMPSSRGSVISSSYKISRVKSWLVTFLYFLLSLFEVDRLFVLIEEILR
jgi:hypothetical protein